MSLLRLLCVACALCAALPAQDPHRVDVRERAARAHRDLQKNRTEVDRLLEMRMRHDLGLPTKASDRTFDHRGDASPVEMDRMRGVLREQEAATLSVRQRYEKLRKAAEQLRADAQASLGVQPNSDPGGMQPLVSVPAPGSTLPSRQASPPTREHRPMPVAPAPGAEMAPSAGSGVRLDPLALDPLRAQIHGSTDHMRVAQALFKAGQALMDRGEIERGRGEQALGKELDDRAKERLTRAVDELAPLLEQEEPPFVALFYLGRCRELLFRYSERHEGLSLSKSPRAYQQREQEVREPFLAISARDVQRDGERNEVEVLGSWGQAAKTAMEHFRWMNMHAAYDARSVIEALTWPGEDER